MNGKIPLYLELYNKIRIDIENGTYPFGEKLPSETELISMYNASRITIRKAISMLANDGYVSVRQGHGTIVASPVMFNTNCVTSLTEQIRAAGYKPSARYVSVTRSYAPKEITDVMDIAESTQMICVQRIQYADEQPFGILTNYIMPELVPDIEHKDLNFISLYRYLEDEYNIRIDTSKDFISARTANISQAISLNIPVGSPLIYVIRVSFSDGIPILGDIVYINGYMHSFSFNRSGQSPRLNIDSTSNHNR